MEIIAIFSDTWKWIPNHHFIARAYFDINQIISLKMTLNTPVFIRVKTGVYTGLTITVFLPLRDGSILPYLSTPNSTLTL